jgi:type I restriction enzyme S subunit
MESEKFCNLFNWLPKSKNKAGEGLDKGEYPFYTSSYYQKKWLNKAQYFSKVLIFGTGGSANIHYVEGRFSTSTDCIVAKKKKEKNANVKYIYYYLKANIYILEKGFQGVGLRHISKSYIENLEIPLPLLEEQDKIVTILDKVQSLIEKREKAVQYLEELQKAVFLDMFGDPIVNPKTWNEKDLSEIAKLERGRFSPRPRNDPSFFNGPYPFIQTGDIANSNYRLSSYKQTLNRKGILVSKKFEIGTIVIALVGATIGTTAILEIDTYATDSIIGIKSNANIVNNVFLEMLLRFQRDKLLETAPSGARANINLTILEKLKIIVPPKEEKQNVFERKYIAIQSNKDKHLNSKHLLDTLFKSLSQRAFSGNISYDIDIELDALINVIDVEKPDFKNDILTLSKDKTLIQRLINRLSNQEFVDIWQYNKAKYVIFRIMNENKELIKQEFDGDSITLNLS